MANLLPSLYLSHFHDFQKTGLQWLIQNYQNNRGSLLADEMGLGKTIQSAGFILWLLQTLKDPKILIICPATILAQWQEELNREIRLYNSSLKTHDGADSSSSRGIDDSSSQVSISQEGSSQVSSSHLDGSSQEGVAVIHDSNDIITPSSTADNHLKFPNAPTVEPSAPLLDPDKITRLLSSGGVQSKSQKLDRPVILASYEFVRLHIKKFNRVVFDACILDEGHRIRNPSSLLNIALKTLTLKTDGGRLILTGTPLQNGLKEFWTLMDFVQPGLLGSLEVFSKYFITPIERGGRRTVTEESRSQSRECISLLKLLIQPHLLRRVKDKLLREKVISLPSKQEHVVACPLTYAQFQIYDLFLTVHNVQKSVAEVLIRGNKAAAAAEQQGRALVFMSMLLKICNHPDIILRHLTPPIPNYGTIERCGKLRVLSELLQSWIENHHKVLIFSQRIQTLNIIQKHIESLKPKATGRGVDEVGGVKGEVVEAPDDDGEAGEITTTKEEEAVACTPATHSSCMKLGRDFLRIDGTVPTKVRLDLIDSFNANPKIFCMLLTTRVGGVGINLTSADRVVLFDPDWNPAMDLQAQERCWRIGQSNKDVRVYRLMSKNTIEEKIYQRQIHKTHLASRILKSEDHKVLKTNDFIEIFAHPQSPCQDGTAIPKELFQQFIKAFKDPSIFRDVPAPTTRQLPQKKRAAPAAIDSKSALLPVDDSSSDEPDTTSPTKRQRTKGGGSSDEEDGEVDESDGEQVSSNEPPAVDGEASLLEQLCDSGAIASIDDHEKLIEASLNIDVTSNHQSFAHRAYAAIVASRRGGVLEKQPTQVGVGFNKWLPAKGVSTQPLNLRVAKISLNLKEQRLRDYLRDVIPSHLKGTPSAALFVKVCQLLMDSTTGVSEKMLEKEFDGRSQAEYKIMKEWLSQKLGNVDSQTSRWIIKPEIVQIVEKARARFDLGIGEDINRTVASLEKSPPSSSEPFQQQQI